MNRFRTFIFLLVTLLMLIPVTIGQDDADVIEPNDPDMMNPEANISYPPPVYVVRDSVDIRGTVTLATMRNFFIEFRPLVLDMMMDDAEEDRQWFPATLPRIEAVQDDVLGAWNTVTLRDGLYELRLTINTGGEMPEYFRVSPIRVENNPPSYAAEQQVIAEPEPTSTPEPPPTPVDTTPRVIVSVAAANVRAGDSTLYAVIGNLLEGGTAKIKGVSSYNTGWYYIALPNGRSGFIHPGIVNTEGDLSNLPRINPPPLPPTPIPIPTAIPVAPAPAQTNADLVISKVVIEHGTLACGRNSSIQVTVENNGSGSTGSDFTVRVVDSTAFDGNTAAETTISFSPLNAGSRNTANGNLRVSTHHGRTHHLNFTVDPDNRVAETNEGNNLLAVAAFVLDRLSC